MRLCVINKENIIILEVLKGKRPTQSIMENIQHKHSYEINSQKIGDIVYINEVIKLQLTEVNKTKRKFIREN